MPLSFQNNTKSRFFLLRLVFSHTRLFMAILFGLIFIMLFPESWLQSSLTRTILTFDLPALFYLILVVHMMFGSPQEKIQQRAISQDEGRFIILTLVVLTAIITLAGVVAELSALKHTVGSQKFLHLSLVGFTIVISWLFTHIMFALHYAHNYFLSLQRNQNGGLIFPGHDQLDYGDFIYFSAVIGTSAQTADVSYSSREMRRTGLLHCILSFFFNTIILALTINMISGLF